MLRVWWFNGNVQSTDKFLVTVNNNLIFSGSCLYLSINCVITDPILSLLLIICLTELSIYLN